VDLKISRIKENENKENQNLWGKNESDSGREVHRYE
jgi:hypothetical protein